MADGRRFGIRPIGERQTFCSLRTRYLRRWKKKWINNSTFDIGSEQKQKVKTDIDGTDHGSDRLTPLVCTFKQSQCWLSPREIWLQTAKLRVFKRASSFQSQYHCGESEFRIESNQAKKVHWNKMKWWWVGFICLIVCSKFSLHFEWIVFEWKKFGHIFSFLFVFFFCDWQWTMDDVWLKCRKMMVFSPVRTYERVISRACAFMTGHTLHQIHFENVIKIDMC